jgi:hypothetical protein
MVSAGTRTQSELVVDRRIVRLPGNKMRRTIVINYEAKFVATSGIYF